MATTICGTDESEDQWFNDEEEDCPARVSTSLEEDEHSFQVIINRVRAVTIKAPIKIQGMMTKAVIDTGAEVTVLSDRLYNEIPEECRPKLKKAKRRLTVADAGKEMRTDGIADMSFNIGKTSFVWPVYVAPIRDDVLLGCDIIDEKDITVNTKKGICISETWIPCDVIRSVEQSAKVKVSRAVTIPANSEYILSGHCNNISLSGTTTYMLEATEEAKGELLIGRCVITPKSNKIPLKVLNSRNVPIRLKKGLILGELHQVETIMPMRINADISKCEESLSLCRLQSTEHKHHRIIPENILPLNLQQETEMRDIQQLASSLPKTHEPKADHATCTQLPQHLNELYEKSISQLNQNQQTRLRKLLFKHQESFAKSKNEVGKCSILKHSIDTGCAAPVRQPLRRTPQSYEGEEDKYVKEQLEAGTIRPSNSAWSSPLVMVRKKSGEIRVCVDYRKLNERTVKDAYPLPRIDMCLDCLSSAKIFSTVDLQSAYMQLEVVEEDRHKTAFITKSGLWEYNVLPFGLCNAPSSFQRCMELIFRGLQWEILLIYLDDIIIMSQNYESHFERLDLVLTKLKEAGLKIKPSKCELFQSEVLFLGHIVGQDGIKPNPQTTKAVEEWKTLTTVKEVMSFLGLCSYYRSYIQNFSHIAAPLTRLTRKNITFQWDNACEEAFQTLKEKLCTAPILAYPKPGLKYILDTDASDVGISAVLSQVQDGKERVISYGSKRLSKEQERYSVTRRELLAVIYFVEKFRHFLLGNRFTLRTDHGSLRWLFEFKNPKGQVARWIEILQQYDMEIVHRSGNKHQNADSLSRRDYEQELCQHDKEFETDCDICRDIKDTWKEFTEETDDTTDLGRRQEAETIWTEQNDNIRALTSKSSKQPVEHKIKMRADNRDPEDIKVKPELTFLPCYTFHDIEDLQRQDADLVHLHDWIDQKLTPQREEVASLSPAVRKYWLNAENLVRRNGVIYRKSWTCFERKEFKLQMLVPKCLKAKVIRDHHDTLTGGHFGVNKTSNKIRTNFHWFMMDFDIRLHIRCCNKCNLNKLPGKRPKTKLRQYQVGYPLDRVGIDIMGPFPLSAQKNKYVLVIGDYFTRYMEAYAIPNQNAENVSHKLVMEFISRYGIPLELHSDQGRNFESDLFKEVLNLLEIKKTRTTAYRPSSNGLIERFNGTLGKMIQKYINSNPINWDKHINLLLAAYRSTVHPSTGYTPNMLMFGREVNLPANLLFPFPRDVDHTETHEYLYQLRDKVEECYHLARENLKEASERQKRDHDTRIYERTYQKGDLVYKRTGPRRKLDDKFEGPFIVKHMFSPDIYEIIGKKKTFVVHHDRLKPFQSEEIPKWARSLQGKISKAC